MSKVKNYKVSKDNFKYFCTECKQCLSFLGICGAPVTFTHERPPEADQTYLGGSIQYADSQKILIYLSSTWPREVTKDKLKYLAAHEAVEILLQQKFLEFAEQCAESGKVNYDRWQSVVHNALNRLLMLYDPDMMTDIAEEPIFETDEGIE